jgi:hypothetical protein
MQSSQPQTCESTLKYHRHCSGASDSVEAVPQRLAVTSSVGLALLSCIAVCFSNAGGRADTFLGMTLIVGLAAAMGLHIYVWTAQRLQQPREGNQPQFASLKQFYLPQAHLHHKEGIEDAAAAAPEKERASAEVGNFRRFAA